MSKHVPQVNRSLFAPHRDWWVTFGALLLIAFFLLAVPLMLWSGLPLWERALSAGVALLLIVSIVDKIFFTVYELNPQGLAIHSQLRYLAVPYRAMESVEVGGLTSLFSTHHRKRFAFSLHNRIIRVRDQMWQEISVSPKRESVFLDQLLANIDAERSRRATVTRSRRT